jgi:hypothetical protein
MLSPETIAQTIPGEEMGTQEIPLEPGSGPMGEPGTGGTSEDMIYIDKMGNDIVIIKYLQPGQTPEQNAEDPKFPRGPFPNDPAAIQREMEAIKGETSQVPGEPMSMPESPIAELPPPQETDTADALHPGTPPAQECSEGEGCISCECEEYMNNVEIALGLKKGPKIVSEAKGIDALSSGGILKSTKEKSAAGAHEEKQSEYRQMTPGKDSTIFKSLGNKKG